MSASTTAKNNSRLIMKLGNIAWSIVRYVVIFGVAFMILKPFIVKIMMAFMSPSDLKDSSVNLISKAPSLFYWESAFDGLNLSNTLLPTLFMSLTIALIHCFISSMIAYGLGRFQFRGRNLAFAFVIIIMLVPSQTYSVAEYMGFKYFLGTQLNLINTPTPLFVLGLCGLGMKQGLYIYLLMSFFKGLPKDLENAAYIDGASPIRAFFSVILPNARTMLVTIFVFSFSWQWTDINFPQLYFSSMEVVAMKPLHIFVRNGLVADNMGSNIAQNAACILILIPLLLLFAIGQKSFTSSIVSSGQAN